MADSPEGLLVIDKPSSISSHRVVNQIRRAFEIKRVGHAGTLDPLATGVLLIGLGRTTRLLNFLQRLPKTYRATIKFGETTTTLDSDGEILDTKPCSFRLGQLEEIALRFVGEIEQVPPMVSALKFEGEPLYKRARRGEIVDRPARKVRIYRLELDDFHRDDWIATITVECSSGTYIRTLAADMGERLGCGAHIVGLRRLNVGSFHESEAVAPDVLEAQPPESRLAKILAPAEAMRDFPAMTVDEEMAREVSHGRPLPVSAIGRAGELPVVSKPREGEVPPHDVGMTAGIAVGVLDKSGRLLAVYRRTRTELRPEVVMVPA